MLFWSLPQTMDFTHIYMKTTVWAFCVALPFLVTKKKTLFLLIQFKNSSVNTEAASDLTSFFDSIQKTEISISVVVNSKKALFFKGTLCS